MSSGLSPRLAAVWATRVRAKEQIRMLIDVRNGIRECSTRCRLESSYLWGSLHLQGRLARQLRRRSSNQDVERARPNRPAHVGAKYLQILRPQRESHSSPLTRLECDPLKPA